MTLNKGKYDIAETTMKSHAADNVCTAGIDVGSRTTKAVVLCQNRIAGSSIIDTGLEAVANAQEALDKALQISNTCFEDLKYIVATGYGRVRVPFADGTVTEIGCHARGTVWLFPQVRTVIDIGGQDCKVIRCDASGKVDKFMMNDKCAAGTGRFLERVANMLNIAVDQLGPLSLRVVDAPAVLNTYCAIFCQVDILTLLNEGRHAGDIVAGALDGLVGRIWNMVERVGPCAEIALVGGVAKNTGVVHRLAVRARAELRIPSAPQLVGALGAALIARAKLLSSSP